MRASRLLSILILLQLRGRMTAEVLAGEFEVSVRTIYRDIDALSAAGVPVYGDKGHGGGFALLDGYRTQLTGFDAEEAEALPLIGLAGPADALGLGAAVERARAKLLVSMSPKGADLAGRMAGRFHVDTVDWYRAGEDAPHLPLLARAALDQRVVAMTYRSWTGERAHRVQPLGVVMKGGGWYLVAKTTLPQPQTPPAPSGPPPHLRWGGVLMFRASSVLSAEMLKEGFERPVGFDLVDWWRGASVRFEQDLRRDVARLRLSAVGLERLAERGRVEAAAVAGAGEPDGRGWREVMLPVEGVERAALGLLVLGAEFEVIGPVALREEVARVAGGIAALSRFAGEGQPRI